MWYNICNEMVVTNRGGHFITLERGELYEYERNQ